uniref:Ejaculatory bulb-specific protein 3 n=2 Tax=Cacopsylla melanoneura TaxID=428564 RepID=A0A8D8TAN6_9HEMI
MQLFLSVSVCVVLSVMFSGPVQSEDSHHSGDKITAHNLSKFLKKFQHININNITHNDRLLTSYTSCFLNKGPCSTESRELKRAFPIIMKTSCGSCKSEQKKKVQTLLKAIKSHKPQEWKEMLALYDPSEEYRKQINKLVKHKKPASSDD